MLGHEHEAHSSDEKEKTASYVIEFANLMSPESTVSCDATREALRDASVKITEKLLSSQELVCGRLRENINKKKPLLISK